MLQLVLVTPERILLDEPVQALRVPMYDGSAGIYPGRAPLVGRLGHDELRIIAPGGNRSYFLDGGFVQVKGRTVSVLTDRAIPTGELDAEKAAELLREIIARVPTTEEAFRQKEHEQYRARRMQALARARR